MGCICTCALAHVQMCDLHVSETAVRIALKFGVWLETHYLGVLQKSRAGYTSKCARAHVQMCFLFRISETAGRIALKLGVSLENR